MSRADSTMENDVVRIKASEIDIQCTEMKLESTIEIKVEDPVECNTYGKQEMNEATIKNHDLIELIDSDSDVPEEIFCTVTDKEYKKRMIKIEKIERVETVPINPPTQLRNANEIESSEKSLVEDNRLPSFCRLCAIPCNDLIHIFGPTPFHKKIVEKIQYCLPITVKKSDTLSKHVCRSCIEKLESCYQFHKTVKQAEEQLFEFYEQTSGTVDQERQIHPQTSGQSNEQSSVTKNVDINGNSGRSSGILDLNRTEPNDYIHPDEDDREMTSEEILDSNKPSTSQKQHGVSNSILNSQTETKDSEEKLQSAKDVSDSEDYSPLVTRRQSDCGVRSYISMSKESPYWMRKRTSQNYYIVDSDLPVCDEGNEGQSSSGACRQVTKGQICRKAFRTAKELYIHSSTHDSPNHYPCCLCNEVYATKEEREEHWSENSVDIKGGKSHRKIRTHRCEECGEKFATRDKLRVHKRDHRSPIKNNVYNDCYKGEVKESNARQGENLLKYTPCKLKLSSHSLERRKRSCAGRKTIHKSSSCGKLSNLRRHVLLTHTRGKYYGCDICTKTFSCECRAVGHRKVHMSKRPFKCTICTIAFNSLQRLVYHMRYVHRRPIRTYPCFLCDKRFMKPTLRQIHMANHTHKSS